ncbi:hypothetical protein R3P38DRAFT_2805200 [Favolaschia claudopus]|uniref:Uncharacterized protein n=1 Tax=Favolaschia claudopus TaxID=2862362 RepID=A0AAV9ZNF3_9AGAR
MKIGSSHVSPARYPDNWDTIPGAAAVPNGMQKQESDFEDSGEKEAGIEDSSAKAHGKRGKRYCVDNSGGKCLGDEVKFGPNAKALDTSDCISETTRVLQTEKTIAAFDTFEKTVGGRILKTPVRQSLSPMILTSPSE